MAATAYTPNPSRRSPTAPATENDPPDNDRYRHGPHAIEALKDGGDGIGDARDQDPETDEDQKRQQLVRISHSDRIAEKYEGHGDGQDQASQNARSQQRAHLGAVPSHTLDDHEAHSEPDDHGSEGPEGAGEVKTTEHLGPEEPRDDDGGDHREGPGADLGAHKDRYVAD